MQNKGVRHTDRFPRVLQSEERELQILDTDRRCRPATGHKGRQVKAGKHSLLLECKQAVSRKGIVELEELHRCEFASRLEPKTNFEE